jgi:protein-tyrosine phosphatase
VIDAHRIAPKLWMGGRPSPEACAAFDVIVLCAAEHQPELPCRTINAPIDDSKPTNDEMALVIKTAKQVNKLRAEGKRVLVTCYEGRNRSGIVVALAMMLNGSTAQSAIGRVRTARKPPSGFRPLSNDYFVRALKRMEEALVPRKEALEKKLLKGSVFYAE